MTQTSITKALGADEPVGLVSVPAEHVEQAREERTANPITTSEVLRQELGPRWARESRATRVEAVKRWLGHHSAGALLKLDIRAQKRTGGILAE